MRKKIGNCARFDAALSQLAIFGDNFWLTNKCCFPTTPNLPSKIGQDWPALSGPTKTTELWLKLWTLSPRPENLNDTQTRQRVDNLLLWWICDNVYSCYNEGEWPTQFHSADIVWLSLVCQNLNLMCMRCPNDQIANVVFTLGSGAWGCRCW